MKLVTLLDADQELIADQGLIKDTEVGALVEGPDSDYETLTLARASC